MASTLDGANTTAQWYEGSYLGGHQPKLEKAVLHSTETRSWPGYRGGQSAPNATYHPLIREIRQHFSNDRSARALRDPSGTAVRENRDGVWQLEIIAYSDFALAQRVGGMWIGDLEDYHFDDIADMLIQLNEDHGLPLHTEVRWAEGQKTYVSGRRLSGPEFDRAKGIMAHFHVSGNTHWDVGGFYISRLMEAITRRSGKGGGIDVATPDQIWNERRKWAAWHEKLGNLGEKWKNGLDAYTMLQDTFVRIRHHSSWGYLVNTLGRAVWTRRYNGDGRTHGVSLYQTREIVGSLREEMKEQRAILEAIAQNQGITLEQVHNAVRTAIESGALSVDINLNAMEEDDDTPIEGNGEEE